MSDEMNKRLHAAAIFIALTQVACADLSKFVEDRREAREQAWIDEASKSCIRYGFKTGTDAFAQCIQSDVNAAKARAAIEEAANPVLPKSTTTSCRKTLTGMDCETR
jgi:hypothetical protein